MNVSQLNRILTQACVLGLEKKSVLFEDDEASWTIESVADSGSFLTLHTVSSRELFLNSSHRTVIEATPTPEEIQVARAQAAYDAAARELRLAKEKAGMT